MAAPFSPNQLLLHLLAEKDRLIREKDELVESKNQLWRQSHDLVREKDHEIDRLRQVERNLLEANERMKVKAKELGEELQQRLDYEEQCAEDDEPPNSKPPHRDDFDEDHNMFEASLDDAEIKRRFSDDKTSTSSQAFPIKAATTPTNGIIESSRRSTSNELFVAQISLSSQARPPAASILNLRDHDMHSGAPAAAQTAHGPLQPDRDSHDRNSSRKSARNAAAQQNAGPSTSTAGATFTYAALIQINTRRGPQYGQMSDLAQPVIKSIRSTIAEVDKWSADGKIPAYPSSQLKPAICAWLWLTGHEHRARWTLESATEHACYACFNAGRACLLWVGNMKWVVLPLPPQARQEGVTWYDTGYYIYEGQTPPSAFTNLWQEPHRKRKRSVPET